MWQNGGPPPGGEAALVLLCQAESVYCSLPKVRIR